MVSTEENEIIWLQTLSEDIWRWLKSLESSSPGFYKFSKNGSLFESGIGSGLGISCLTLKLIYMLGLEKYISNTELDNWTNHIKSFQTKEGYFEDPFLMKELDKRAGIFRRNTEIRTAETRQAFASLLCFKQQPNYELPKIPQSAAEIKRFIQKLHWDIPYASGSHVSHLMAFHYIKGTTKEPSGPIETIVSELDKIRDSQTGTWHKNRNLFRNIRIESKRYFDFLSNFPWLAPWKYTSEFNRIFRYLGIETKTNSKLPKENQMGKSSIVVSQIGNTETGSMLSKRPSHRQLINGAMKILTGYSFCNVNFDNPESLIDMCLDNLNDSDGCDNADVVYVLHQCIQITDYRSSEIMKYALNRITHIRKFQISNGGFSYFLNQSQTSYYGVKVSRGMNEADIHGTTLFIWALVMLADILGWKAKLSWKLPVT